MAAPLSPPSLDADASDPPILRASSSYKSYTIDAFHYADLRVFHHPHPDPSPSRPLIVCIHGLGGSVAQFAALLPRLTQLCSVVAIDLPGCGRSAFSEYAWAAYTPAALVQLLDVAVAEVRQPEQHVVLVGHSMGTALASQLADDNAAALAPHVAALVALCPISAGMNVQRTTLLRRLIWVPGWVFNLWRIWDRRGGEDSASVTRFVGADAPRELKALQHRFNTQSQTPVWRRMVWGMLPLDHAADGTPIGGATSLEVWGRVQVPVLLIGGAEDKVTAPQEVELVASAVRASAYSEAGTAKVVETRIMDSPANHTLLYDPRIVPELQEIIAEFLMEHTPGLA
ncbi:hypothetical protein TD95_000109 [Thielaviopsis punctulata]|uniref:AB hydrolase-1 domain-containing protein n=1 Tax=Thielaviopsis punctulata TaxID=72032 RepID=A0A0F4Z829_9PEZI|nr:hypothetical protein TD95_000109 [Thielaviopsis punctulata]